jgi:hypothetical protein
MSFVVCLPRHLGGKFSSELVVFGELGQQAVRWLCKGGFTFLRCTALGLSFSFRFALLSMPSGFQAHKVLSTAHTTDGIPPVEALKLLAERPKATVQVAELLLYLQKAHFKAIEAGTGPRTIRELGPV